jgi:hypothetical protein
LPLSSPRLPPWPKTRRHRRILKVCQKTSIFASAKAREKEINTIFAMLEAEVDEEDKKW